MSVNSQPNLMEAECKYRVENCDTTRALLKEMKATFIANESQCDTYLRHPNRDFRTTDEALRLRECNGLPFITYKGPRVSGPIKIRPEIELPLAPDTASDWLRIWENLGFSIAAQVRKERQVYRIEFNNQEITIALDRVTSLGDFVEIEQILHSPTEIDAAQANIQAIASRLKLTHIEKRSYLGMLLSLSQTAESK